MTVQPEAKPDDRDDRPEIGRPESGKSTSWRRDLGSVRRLLRYMRPYRGRFIAGLVAGAAYGALSGVFPKAVEVYSRRLFESGDRPAAGSVLLIALAIPVYFTIRGLMGFLNTYCLTWVSSRMLRDIRVELFCHIQKMPLEFFVRKPVSKLIQRVHQNPSAVQGSLVQLAGDVIKQPITIIVAIIVLASIDLWFCLFALVVGILCLIPMTYFGRKVRKASHAEEQSEGGLLATLHETFANALVVKAYNLEGIQEKRLKKAAERQLSRSLYFKRQQEMVSPLIEVVGSVGMAAALFYVYTARIQVSEFLAVVAGFFMMYEPLKRMGRLYVVSQRMLNRAEKIFTVLDSEPDRPDPIDAVDLTQLEREIRFEGVHFGYRRGGDVLSDIDFTVPRGNVCALFGPSGSGKTSLVNLLMRLYTPDRGRILIDGRDLASFTTKSLRKRIGLVTQETLLFEESIAENIARGKPNASREEIVEAARRAHAHDFILALPQGYDTELNSRAKNLSGGQAQRISIARAFLKNPAILILDEATSALDAESEEKVQQATSELMHGRTVIIIAHRLSALRKADQLVVLDHGRIVAVGSHEELMQSEGVYRRLYDLQVV